MNMSIPKPRGTKFGCSPDQPPSTRRSRRFLRLGRFRPTTSAFTITAAMGCTQAGRYTPSTIRPRTLGISTMVRFKSGLDGYGVYFDVGLTAGATDLGFILHRGGEKDPGPDMHVNPQTQGFEIWVVSGSTTIYSNLPTAAQLLAGELSKLQAIWIDPATIVLPRAAVQPGMSYALTVDPNAAITLSSSGVNGGTTYELTQAGASLTSAQLAQFPQLTGYIPFQVPINNRNTLARALTGELVVSGVNGSSQLMYVTQVQTFGILDSLFSYDGKLGVIFSGEQPSIKVWAPTAKSVKLQLFDTASQVTPTRVVNMSSRNGVWSVLGSPSWKGSYYLFDVTVYVPSLQAIVENVVTDPYSLSLSLNSQKSQMVSLEDSALGPPGWEESSAPDLRRVNDLSIYELHIRDFSANDASVPAVQRGTYLAFTNRNSNGMRHLRSLAQSGLKAVHLLPSFDIASVNEDKTSWQTTGDLSVFS